MKWIVTMEVLISTQIEVEIEADSKGEALDKGVDLIPHKRRIAETAWRFQVDVTPPKGVVVRKARPVWIQQTSGGETARQLGEEKA